MKLSQYRHAIIGLALLFAPISMPLFGQSQPEIFSIVTVPGENASHQMRISWGTDSIVAQSCVKYHRLGDKNPKHTSTVYPQQHEFCTVFSGKYSKRADGSNFNENGRFFKCGAELNSLKPNTEYEYEIVSSNGTSYGPYRFKTAGAKEWSCCIISDFHSYPPLGHRLKAAMQMIQRVEQFDPSMDWVLHVGDVCAWGGSYSFWQRLYEEAPFKQYLWAGVNGNHDNMSRGYELTNQYFRNTSFYPENGYEGEKGVCYYFRYGDALFIMLNNEDMRSDEGLAAAQQWVKDVVTHAKNQSHAPKYIIVCEHYQWFMGENGKAVQYKRWSQLFDELGVDLAIAGNNHIYARTGILYQGSKTDGKHGTMYLQTSSSDNERGSKMQELTDNQQFIEYRYTDGPRTVSAVNMKVNKKGISLALLNREGQILDRAFVPVKKKK